MQHLCLSACHDCVCNVCAALKRPKPKKECETESMRVSSSTGEIFPIDCRIHSRFGPEGTAGMPRMFFSRPSPKLRLEICGFAQCLAKLWRMFGETLAKLWRLFGECGDCLAIVWRSSGDCLSNALRMSRRVTASDLRVQSAMQRAALGLFVAE